MSGLKRMQVEHCRACQCKWRRGSETKWLLSKGQILLVSPQPRDFWFSWVAMRRYMSLQWYFCWNQMLVQLLIYHICVDSLLYWCVKEQLYGFWCGVKCEMDAFWLVGGCLNDYSMGMPAYSSKPRAMFKFYIIHINKSLILIKHNNTHTWTAWVAAPFKRLSMVAATTTRLPSGWTLKPPIRTKCLPELSRT